MPELCLDSFFLGLKAREKGADTQWYGQESYDNQRNNSVNQEFCLVIHTLGQAA
jgi:hypothetical protein